MTNTPEAPISDPTSAQSSPSSSKLPLILVGLLLILSAGAGGVYLGKYLYAPKTPVVPALIVAPTAVPTPNPTANWKTYSNAKYGYSVKYPSGYLVGFADARVGKFNEGNGNEDQVDFLPSTADEFNNFLQIQVADLKTLGKTPAELADSIYQKQRAHFQTTYISNLARSKLGDYDDYEYTFSGQAVFTLSWDGAVKSGKYKIVIFQKDENVYSLYLKDSDTFDQILSTFKFTE